MFIWPIRHIKLFMRRKMNKIKKIYYSIREFVKKSMDDDIPVFAAQASFFMIFSVIPFVMLLITLLKYIFPVDIDQTLDFLSFYLPSELMSYVSTMLVEVFDKSLSGAGSVSIVTAASTLWLASKSIMSLYTGINRIYLPDKSLSYLTSRILSLFYTLIFILVIIATIVVFGFGKSIEGIIYENMPMFVPVIDIILRLRTIVFIVVLTLMFASFYKILPRTDMSFSKQLPGAICASAGWMIFSWIYSLYIHYISNYSYVYGSLAAVVFLMLWLYICMNIFLCGAEFNKVISEKKLQKRL